MDSRLEAREPARTRNEGCGRTDAAHGASRTSFVLDSAQIEFLDRFSAIVRANCGRRLTKRSVIETLVNVLPMARISLEDVICETDLKEMLRRPGVAGTHAISPSDLERFLSIHLGMAR